MCCFYFIIYSLTFVWKVQKKTFQFISVRPFVYKFRSHIYVICAIQSIYYSVSWNCSEWKKTTWWTWNRNKMNGKSWKSKREIEKSFEFRNREFEFSWDRRRRRKLHFYCIEKPTKSCDGSSNRTFDTLADEYFWKFDCISAFYEPESLFLFDLQRISSASEFLSVDSLLFFSFSTLQFRASSFYFVFFDDLLNA